MDTDLFDRPLPAHPRWRRALLERLAAPFLRPRRVVADPAEAGAAPWEPLQVRSPDGLRLAAYAALQEKAAAPGLVLVHGYGSSIDETQHLGNALWERGFQVLLFEFRACGQSEGRLGSLTRLETAELEAAVRAFRERVAPEAPVGLHGFSMGAVAIINALKRGLAVGSVSFDCPFADLAETIAFQKARMAWHRRALAPISQRAAEALLGFRAHEVRPLEGVERLRTPALFIVSTADTAVPPSHTRLLAERWGGPTETWEHMGLEHCQARFACWDEYLGRLAAWHAPGADTTVADRPTAIASVR